MSEHAPTETRVMEKLEIEEAAAGASQAVAGDVEVPAVPVTLPVFSQRHDVDGYPLIDSQTAALLGSTNKLVIQQDIKWIEAITQGCIEQANSYKIFDSTGNNILMKVKEESNDCNRCFCAPNHSFVLHFTAVDAQGAELFPVMTMERVGCCHKCVACFACFQCCLDSMRLHAGHVTGYAGQMPSDKVIGSTTQTRGGGGFHPVLHVMDTPAPPANRAGTDPIQMAAPAKEEMEMTSNPAEPPLAIIKGPTCFGGCSELCCSSPFQVARVVPGTEPSQYKKLNFGDVATITKLKPSNLGFALRELLTDADVYEVVFNDTSITPQQKATLLGAVMHLDYMFFERDNDTVGVTTDEVRITLCNCYCYGCICPCTIRIKYSDLHD